MKPINVKEVKVNNKIRDLERIAEEADLAALALTSCLLGENEALIVLQKRMVLVSTKAKGLLELELSQIKL